MKILIANPNTNQLMTDLMVQEARQYCRPDTTIEGLSAEFGVPYIATRSELSIAEYALLERLAKVHGDYDAVVVGVFSHAMVAAAKELLPIPVIGIAEASMRSALFWGDRVGIIGVGTHERAANEAVVASLKMQSSVPSIRLLPLSGTELVNDQTRADTEAIRLGQLAVEEDNADVLVLAGAAFSGMAQRIAEHLPVPVVCPVPYAVALAETAVLTPWQKPTRGTYCAPTPKPITGVSIELASFYPPESQD